MRRAIIVAGTVVGLGAVLSGSAAGYAYYLRTTNAVPMSSLGEKSSVLLQTSGAEPTSNNGATTNVSDGSAVHSNDVNSNKNAENTQQNSIISNNSLNISSEKSATNYAPTLEELSSYEQYHNSATVMIGDIAIGSGSDVHNGSHVTINYRGWLTDGKLFDESYSRQQPLSFGEGSHQVVLGMEEGLTGMKVGGKRRIIIPPILGYGATANAVVPANSVMVFDVELVASD